MLSPHHQTSTSRCTLRALYLASLPKSRRHRIEAMMLLRRRPNDWLWRRWRNLSIARSDSFTHCLFDLPAHILRDLGITWALLPFPQASQYPLYASPLRRAGRAWFPHETGEGLTDAAHYGLASQFGLVDIGHGHILIGGFIA
ncbi:hypothetical protein PENSPDRAFT_154007 [Peniophora sp. CONT]|nr:hypothetical protein PENSPDRAFT_154007 [Peniophora sp. CONT]